MICSVALEKEKLRLLQVKGIPLDSREKICYTEASAPEFKYEDQSALDYLGDLNSVLFI